MEEPKIYALEMGAPVIWKTHFNHDWNAIAPYAEKLLAHAEKIFLTLGNAKSTAIINNTAIIKNELSEQPHAQDCHREFMMFLRQVIQEISVQLGYTENLHYVVRRSWYNDFGSSGKSREHTHGSTIFAVVTYLQAPPNSAEFMYRDLLAQYRTHEPWGRNGAASAPWKALEISEGDVLIFPGWLPHKTAEHQPDARRIAMSLNIRCTTENFVKQISECQGEKGWIE